MTREEQIRKAARNLTISVSRADKATFAREVFEAGAKWADNNPKSPWISVEERLPEEGTAILEAYTLTVEYQGVKEEKECILKSMYNRGFVCDGKKRNIMGGTTCNTTHHWMPIPELPKKEE